MRGHGSAGAEVLDVLHRQLQAALTPNRSERGQNGLAEQRRVCFGAQVQDQLAGFQRLMQRMGGLRRTLGLDRVDDPNVVATLVRVQRQLQVGDLNSLALQPGLDGLPQVQQERVAIERLLRIRVIRLQPQPASAEGPAQ